MNNDSVSIKRKFAALWADGRSYIKRLRLAGAAILAACFTFLFFGPLELVAFSGDSLVYTYQDVVWILAFAAGGVFVAAAFLISLLRGKIFNYAVSVIFAVTVAGYLQAAFMNSSLGTLTGDSIDWAGETKSMIVNLLIWLSVLLVTFLIMYLHRETWKKVISYVSLALVVMQMVPAVGIFTGAYSQVQPASADAFFLSEKGMYEFSANDNIFVFVLDRLDYSYIQRALAEDPAMLDGLDGFTGYTNAISAYARTRPALIHMLTGYEETAYTESATDYYQRAWTSGDTNILTQLQEQEYSVSMYTKLNYVFSDMEYAQTYVSNVSRGRGDLLLETVWKKLMKLSAYRYAPMAIKPFFWADTNYYNTDVYADSAYEFNDSQYAQGFVNSTADISQSSFKLYHFFGPHAPYSMNADGTATEGETTVTEQTRGSFANLQKIFEKMKELGIYEDATILITGDHGNAISDKKPIQQATRIGLFYKPSGSADTPLVFSDAPVCTDNIPATIAKAAGVDYSRYGSALDDIKEDASILRYTYKSVIGDQGGREIGVYTYEITGDAADFSNWKMIDYADIDYSFY